MRERIPEAFGRVESLSRLAQPVLALYIPCMKTSNGILRLALLSCLFACLFAGVATGVAGAQPGSGRSGDVFPRGDTFRTITEPIDIGIAGFAQRIALVRESGREPLGLVLAGGSARAYAHIGVLQILEAEGIKPDFIVANSMGAVIGMLYAAGLSPALLEKIVETLPTERYLDFVLPLQGGLIDSSDFAALAEELVGDIDLSDVDIPIIVTAEDLLSRRQARIASGDFATVLRTTFALPAIFEPVPFEGSLLVDGGVTNLVPVAIAAEYSTKLIVSTALYDVEMSYGNPVSVINRTIDIGKSRSGVADLLAIDPFIIRNDVENISYMKFGEPKAIVEAGRRSARAALPELKLYAGEASKPIADKESTLEKEIPPLVSKFSRGAFPSRDFAVKGAFFASLLEPLGHSGENLDFMRSAGAGVRFAAGRARARAAVLAVLGGDLGQSWALEAEIAATPFDSLLLQASARISGGIGADWSSPVDISAIEASGWLGWPLRYGQAELEPFAAGSLSRDLASGTNAYSISAGLRARTPRLNETARFGAGQAAGELSLLAGAFYSVDASFGPEFRLAAGWGIPETAAVRVGLSGEFDLAGAGIEFRSSEAYRGILPAGTAAHAVILNSGVSWLAELLEFSMGELVLVKGIEIGPYADFAWLGSDPAALTAGLDVSLTASFAGLAPGDLTLFAGLDSGFSPVFGLRAGRVFPIR